MEQDLKQYSIPNDHLVSVCKYRQGEQCCKYIVYLTKVKDFCCSKNVEHLKNQVDSQANMIAKGDNCEGIK